MDEETSHLLLGKDRGWRPRWERAYVACRAAMYRKARRVLSECHLPSGTAEDVVQEAWEAILRLDPSSIRNLEALAVTITSRKAFDRCRRAPPSSPVPEDLPTPSAEETYMEAEGDIRCLQVARESLDTVLDPTERLFFVECQLKGRKRESVAEEAGVSRQWVGQVVKKATTKLQNAAITRLGPEEG